MAAVEILYPMEPMETRIKVLAEEDNVKSGTSENDCPLVITLALTLAFHFFFLLLFFFLFFLLAFQFLESFDFVHFPFELDMSFGGLFLQLLPAPSFESFQFAQPFFRDLGRSGLVLPALALGPFRQRTVVFCCNVAMPEFLLEANQATEFFVPLAVRAIPNKIEVIQQHNLV